MGKCPLPEASKMSETEAEVDRWLTRSTDTLRYVQIKIGTSHKRQYSSRHLITSLGKCPLPEAARMSKTEAEVGRWLTRSKDTLIEIQIKMGHHKRDNKVLDILSPPRESAGFQMQQ